MRGFAGKGFQGLYHPYKAYKDFLLGSQTYPSCDSFGVVAGSFFSCNAGRMRGLRMCVCAEMHVHHHPLYCVQAHLRTSI